MDAGAEVAADPARLDFFISYTSVDEPWVTWIAQELDAAGYQVLLQAWGFRPGQDFLTLMEDGIRRADRVLVVLSAAYTRSVYATAEWRAVYTTDVMGEQGRLIPVRVEDCEPPPLLRSRVYLDLAGVGDEQAARARLLAGVAPGRARLGEPVGFPGDLIPPATATRSSLTVGQGREATVVDSVQAGRVSADPWVNQAFARHWQPRARGVQRRGQPGWLFTGRVRALRDLVDWLTGPPGQVPSLLVVTGDPGSGKSAVLARLVTLPVAAYRAEVPEAVLAAAPQGTVPAPGSVQVAVHAAGKTPEQLTEELAAAVGRSAGSPQELTEQFLEQDPPPVVVVDSLDEATPPELLIRDLLLPLALRGTGADRHPPNHARLAAGSANP